MGTHYSHLSFEERKLIETNLNIPNISLKRISSSLHRSDRCIRYEIKSHRFVFIRPNKRNKCGRQNTCTVKHLCNSCANGKCRLCSYQKCNNLCPDFIEYPICKRLERFPFVCSNCKDLQSCILPKYFYVAAKANEQAYINNSSWKTGPKKSIQDLETIIPAVQSGVAKNQSPAVIIHEHKLPISVSTLYDYIDKGFIPHVRNIDLKAKVRYKIRKQSPKERIVKDYAFLDGRRYEDFVEIALKSSVNIWEMDTVIGLKEGKQKCILTLLHRKSNLQLYFLLEEKTAAQVQLIFDSFKEFLGPQLFKETFPVILTDNGSEFSDPLSLEIDPNTGEQLINIYYCQPKRSEQKGKCERNHEILRYMIPKGKSMNSLSQKDMNHVSLMINNYPRPSLMFHSPLSVAQIFLNKKVFELNRLSPINAKTIVLTPIIK